MAGEIELAAATGQTLYAVVRDATGRPWNMSLAAFEAFTPANYANYAVTLAEQSTSGYYVGDFPSGIVARGLYGVVARVQAGGSPAQGDTLAGSGQVAWTGTAQQSIANLALDASGDVTLTAAEHTAISGTDVPTGVAPIKTKTDQLHFTGTLVDANTLAAGDILSSGVATAGGNASITLAVGSSGVDDYYNGCIIWLVGNGADPEVRVVADYDGATRIATFDVPTLTARDNTTSYIIPFSRQPGVTAAAQVFVPYPIASATVIATPSSSGVTVSNLPIELNIKLARGTDFAFNVLVKAPDGTPINLTGATVEMLVLASQSSSDPTDAAYLLKLTSLPSGGITILDQTVPANVGYLTIQPPNVAGQGINDLVKFPHREARYHSTKVWLASSQTIPLAGTFTVFSYDVLGLTHP